MITLFHAYSRSGGTLLNRILAAMPDNVVLSEVLPTTPRGGTIPGIESGGVWHQALYWYDIRLKNKEYIPAILELEDVCQRSGRHLIVREWCVGCYPPHTKIFSEHNISPPYGLFDAESFAQENKPAPSPSCATGLIPLSLYIP